MNEITRRSTAKQRVLDLLRSRGTAGATNVDMNNLCCFRYASRIHELRKEGHHIERRNGHGRGVFVYFYRGYIDAEVPQSLPFDSLRHPLQ